jgi:outer membrane receptor for ferrienterochelin and colicins
MSRPIFPQPHRQDAAQAGPELVATAPGRVPRTAARLALCGALLLAGLATAQSGGRACAAESPSQTAADASEMSLDELLKVKVLKVYGVSHYEQNALEAPGQVTVVTAEEIRRYDYRLLSDLLNGVAGLYVTNDRNYRYLGYRGFSRTGDYNTRVLIMIDGVRLNDEVYHQAPVGLDFPLDLRLVDHVEVVRGPSQALYGNNAFLLVINVITANPSGLPQVEGEISADTRRAATARVTAGGPVSRSGAGVLISGSLSTAPGSDLYLPHYNDPATNNGVARDSDYARSGSAFFKYSRSQFTLLGGFQQDRKGIPTGAWGTTFNDNSSRTDDRRYFADLSYHAIESPSGALKLRSYLNAYDYDGNYSYAPQPSTQDHSRAVTGGVEVVGNLVLPWHNILASGLEYRHAFRARQFDSTGFQDNRSIDEVGCFLQDEYRPFEPLILTGSLRFDRMSQGQLSLSPKGAVVLLPAQGLALKYLFGRSFRAPNAYELAYAGSGYRANPGLQEEVMYSNELIAEYQASNALRASMTGFQYDYRDLISTRVDADGILSFANAGRIRTRGVETEISANWQAWSGSLAHTYQNSSQSDAPGQPIANSPHHLVKLRLSRELLRRGVTLAAELNYTSRLATQDPAQDAPGYLVANLTLRGRDLLIKGLDASLSIYNLFDRQYSQPGGIEHLPTALIPQEGISAALRLGYRY